MLHRLYGRARVGPISPTSEQHDHLGLLHTVAPDLPMIVLGDLARIRQILVHQLSNALKFTRQGCVQIRVTRYDGSEAPERLLQAKAERMQQLHDLIASDAFSGKELEAAQAELDQPQMLVIQPPTSYRASTNRPGETAEQEAPQHLGDRRTPSSSVVASASQAAYAHGGSRRQRTRVRQLVRRSAAPPDTAESASGFAKTVGK